MTRKPTRRIEFTVPEELGEQYDEARGLIPMATWIKAIIADELGPERFVVGTTPSTLITPFQPGYADRQAEVEKNAYLDEKAAERAAAKSSADAKRAVRPIPKGK